MRHKGTRGFTTPGRALTPWQAAAGHLRAACRDLAFALCLLAPVLALAAPTGAAPDASSDAGKASEEKPLIFLSEAAHPPYAYWGPKGEMVGFEIDLMNAVCAEMKANCTIVESAWDGIIRRSSPTSST